MAAQGDALMAAPALDLLERKARAFEELLALSKGQDAVLELDDPEALLELLARKQAVLHRVEGIDRELRLDRGPDPAAEPPPGGESVLARTRATLARIRATLEALQACEDATQRRVEDLKRGTLAQISRIRHGRRAAELYRSLPPGGGALDREE